MRSCDPRGRRAGARAATPGGALPRAARCSLFSILPVLVVLLLTVGLMMPVLAAGLSFSQDGATILATTENETARWHVDAYWSVTTETPIPATGGNLYNDWWVATGTVSHSVVIPPEYRRMRFDVASFVPTEAGTPVSEFSGIIVGQDEWGTQVCGTGRVVWKRGESQMNLWPYGDPITLTGLEVQVGDELRVECNHGGVTFHTFLHSGITTGDAGGYLTLEHGYDDEVPDDWHRWVFDGGGNQSISVVEGYVPGYDDSGTGEFENPDWYGFDPPVAVASASSTDGVEPFLVSFGSAGSYDPNGGALGYAWAFGDGDSSEEASPTHVYTEPGSYTAVLTVTDAQGDWAQAAVPVTVSVSEESSATSGSVVPSGTVGIGGIGSLGSDALDVLVALAVGGCGWAFGTALMRRRRALWTL